MEDAPPIYSTSVVPPGRNKFGRGYAKNLPPASFLHAAPVKRKDVGIQTLRPAQGLAETGVVPIGLGGIDGPVDLAPFPGGRKTLEAHRPCGG